LRAPIAGLVALALACSPAFAPVAARPAGPGLPSKLPDRDFWQLIASLSEPGGHFQSDNLVSNERLFQQVVPTLRAMPRGGVYVGVAPDQNFTYIAALEPRMAFIVDIRRGNLVAHLLYKAIFELAGDRAEFASWLFSRETPRGVDRRSPVEALMAAFARVPPDEARIERNVHRIQEHLVRRHRFPLTAQDLESLRYIYGMFGRHGPELTYATSQGRGRRNMPTFGQLQAMTDLAGDAQSYLGRDDAFQTVRDLQRRNLVVPVVGDFAGPRALRALGAYLSEHGAAVTAFYTSNVEQYLFQQGRWGRFSQSVAAMPRDPGALFIRSARGSSLVDPIAALLADAEEGKIRTYADITRRGAIR
jgi:hypothetical protein